MSLYTCSCEIPRNCGQYLSTRDAVIKIPKNSRASGPFKPAFGLSEVIGLLWSMLEPGRTLPDSRTTKSALSGPPANGLKRPSGRIRVGSRSFLCTEWKASAERGADSKAGGEVSRVRGGVCVAVVLPHSSCSAESPGERVQRHPGRTDLSQAFVRPELWRCGRPPPHYHPIFFVDFFSSANRAVYLKRLKCRYERPANTFGIKVHAIKCNRRAAHLTPNRPV